MMKPELKFYLFFYENKGLSFITNNERFKSIKIVK
jgi:hypothetical protein